MIPYFSAHCISDHRISKPNPNSNPNLNHNPNPNPTTIHKDGLSTFLTTQNNPKFNLKQNTNPTISNPKPK